MARNLDKKNEETAEMMKTAVTQNQLEKLLQETILPNTFFEVEQRWSGIMVVGSQKKANSKTIFDQCILWYTTWWNGSSHQ